MSNVRIGPIVGTTPWGPRRVRYITTDAPPDNGCHRARNVRPGATCLECPFVVCAHDSPKMGRGATRPRAEVEQQIIDLAAKGLGTGMIAEVIGVSPRSVYRRKADIRKRLGAEAPRQVAGSRGGSERR